MGHRTSGDIARDLSRQPTFLSRYGLRTAVQNIFRPSRESSSEGSNITLPVPRTGTVRNSNDSKDVGEFDLPALRKVRRGKERNDSKNRNHVAGFEDVHNDASTTITTAHTPIAFSFCNPDGDNNSQEASSSDSDFSVYSCASEGSEVEVDGGVALTEEAVETHTPDILAIDVSAEKNATMVQDVEMADGDDEDDVEADIGLQSIMAQV